MVKSKKKSFTIVEIAAIVSTVTLTGFLGFTYVNSQQKLALTDKGATKVQPQAPEQTQITADDIKPIDSSADLNVAYSQLDAMEAELSSAADTATLTEDLNTIIE